jgi:hypothetical protein
MLPIEGGMRPDRLVLGAGGFDSGCDCETISMQTEACEPQTGAVASFAYSPQYYSPTVLVGVGCWLLVHWNKNSPLPSSQSPHLSLPSPLLKFYAHGLLVPLCGRARTLTFPHYTTETHPQSRITGALEDYLKLIHIVI